MPFPLGECFEMNIYLLGRETSNRKGSALVACFLGICILAKGQSPVLDLGPILEPILSESELPSIAAAVMLGEDLRGIGALGVRKLGDPTLVTKEDKYHIGSCTKMMTATLAAVLIEEGLLGWETTIGEVLKTKIHPTYRDVTLEQLLTHTGGFPQSPPRKAWAEAWKNQGGIPATEQRLAFISPILASKPAYSPGTKTLYSNQGYAVAGAMLEILAGKPWEVLLRDRVFEPLGMDSAGFRAPCSADKIDQPWGHNGRDPIAPDPVKSDNPDAIGPAGTVHLSMRDLIKFAGFHLERKPGGLLKKAESFEKLNSTLPKSGSHGVGGWLVHDLDRFGGHCLQMTGSNTMWFTIFWVFPAYDMAIVVSTNAAPKSAFETCDKAVAALLTEYRKE